MTYYFSDCQTGAAAGCVVGSNSNAGTSAALPKQNLSGINLDSLPAGSRLLFARGGAWTNFGVSLRNLNVTPTAPLVFDAYGTGAAPWLKTSLHGFNFGAYNDTVADGGYTIRNIKLDGQGTAGAWGFFLHNANRNITIENVEVTGFELGIHAQQTAGVENVGLVVRNSNIHHNSGMGMLGDAIDMVLEGNTFAYNNFSGSTFNHAIYLSGHGRNGVMRNNTFTNNSVVNGVCQGGNVTVHGQWDGLVIEGNTITQAASSEGCWGFSLTPGYANSAEWFRNAVVRNNTITNLGGCAVCVISAPGVLIEGNRIFNSQASQIAVTVSPPFEAGDDTGLSPTVSNNTICFTQPNASSAAVAIRVSGGTETGTVYRTGANATTGACAQ
ncbi:right-handed parallel beta-helix repeat-containing protein [Sphaerotilaceae bacterium SBD11-9]